MGKTADWTVVQKTVIVSLAILKVIAKEAMAVHRVL